MTELVIGAAVAIVLAVAIGAAVISDIRGKRRLAELEESERRAFRRIKGVR